MKNILKDFQENLLKQNWGNKKIILATSGGADSMVMAALFQKSNERIVLAHFNYALRGIESEGDQELVQSWAESQNIPFYTKKFELGKKLEEVSGNLQEIARNLRYDWFEELRISLDFDFIATAHHQLDSVETMLINFFKGTGISGLHGILNQNGKIIRPMLLFKKEEIERYAEEMKVPWRMDSSNKKNDYARNKIRNQVIPLLKEAFPNVENNLTQNIKRFQEVEMIYQDAIEQYKLELLEKRGNDWYIPILKLKKIKPIISILYELLHSFGFKSSQMQSAMNLIEAETGSILKNDRYRIIKNRNFLIITPCLTNESTYIIVENLNKLQSVSNDLFSLKMEVLDYEEENDWNIIKCAKANEAYLDLDKLEFPLVIRPWKHGDYFYPLGMQKKKKKVSRFLIDSKIPLHKKEQIWVLMDKNKFVWLFNFRIDERFKVTKSTKKLAHLKLNIKSA